MDSVSRFQVLDKAKGVTIIHDTNIFGKFPTVAGELDGKLLIELHPPLSLGPGYRLVHHQVLNTIALLPRPYSGWAFD